VVQYGREFWNARETIKLRKIDDTLTPDYPHGLCPSDTFDIIKKMIYLNLLDRNLLLLTPHPHPHPHAPHTPPLTRTLLTHKHITKLPPQLHIIISKLSDLRLIETQLLLLHIHPQAQARNEIHQEEDDAGAEEGIREAGHAVGELVRELDVVAVEPAARDHGEAIQVGYVVAVSRQLAIY
jgi:hypothetical protein